MNNNKESTQFYNTYDAALRQWPRTKQKLYHGTVNTENNMDCHYVQFQFIF